MQTVQDNEKIVSPHKEGKALFQLSSPSAGNKLFLFLNWGKKRKKNKPCLAGLFWPKQIGLLVLAKREEFIHEQGEWKVTRTIHLTDSPKTRLCILHWPQLLYIFPKRRFICCATEQETMW